METLQSILSSLIPKRNLTAPQRSTPSALLNERPVMCSTCQDAELLSVKIDGLWYAEPCPDCAQRRMADRMQAFSNMTTDERRASLNDIIVEQGTDTARMIEAARAFIDRPRGMLTIYGTCGNAKTVALQAIVNALLARNIPAIYLPFYDVLSYVKEAFKQTQLTPHGIDLANYSAHRFCALTRSTR